MANAAIDKNHTGGTDADGKAALRARAHAQRATLGSSDRAEAAEAAAIYFSDNIPISEGATIALYWPIRDEIDCKPLLVRLMDSSQRVCLPVVVGEEQPLLFRLWDQGAPLYPAGFGTLAPAEDAPVVAPDMIVIPLLGFDSRGGRLGYGRGYYDRTIASLPKKPVLVGYAFAVQELESVPMGAHDVPLDYLVTETGARKFAR